MGNVERYRWIEQLWTGQRWDEWTATVAPGYVFEPGIGAPRDLAGTLAWSRGMFAAFPDLAQTVEHVIDCGDTVVGVTRVHGTHTGTLDLGLGDPVPPTGGSFDLPYVKVLHFDAAGLVEHDTQYLEAGLLLRQLYGGAPD